MQMSLPQILTPKAKITYPRKVLTGTGIDEVYAKKTDDIRELQANLKTLTKEKEELKLLNEKFMDRVDFLQQIIEKEASANTYYYNYPPKADATLA